MLFRNVLFASAAASLGVAAPAAACDQHGVGQMGGFHRYNPFASAINNIQSVPSTDFAKDETKEVRRKKSDKAEKEDKRRQEALEAEANADAQNARSNGARGRYGQGRQPAIR